MNKYYRNLILCGDIDFHCLICEETFHYVADVDRHVRWESHRKKLKAHTYLIKFKGDFILKIGDFYYCEVCNIVLPTALKTNLHINEEKHIGNRDNPTQNTTPKTEIIRDAGTIKISSEIIINESDWNGIVDDHCIICDTDFEEMEGHITETKHVINLIQSKVELQPEKIYRKIGGDILYCFLCKAPLPMSFLDKHWTSKEHCDKKKNVCVKIVNNGASTSGFSAEFKNNMKRMFAFSDTTSNKKKNETETKNNDSEILPHVQEFQKGGIDINFERSSAKCKVCNFSPAFTVKAIQGHIKMHKKAEKDSPVIFVPTLEMLANMSDSDDDDDEDWMTEESDDDFDSIGGDTIVEDEEETKPKFTGSVSDFVKMKEELRTFGKQNNMKLVADGSKGYCTLCETYISAHIKNFKQHVQGARHIGNKKPASNTTTTKSNAQKPNGNEEKEYSTKTLKKYLRNIFFVKNMDDFWVNRTFCIDKHSFFIVCTQEQNGKFDKMKCFICNDVFPVDKDQAHCQRADHKDKMFATKVVTSLRKEFVREIRPNIFHCGFCNEVEDGWDSMKMHLVSRQHREYRQQQKLVADMTDDMYGMHMEDTNTADTDIMWMHLMGNRLF